MLRIVLVVGQIKFEDKVRDDEIIIIVIKKYIKKIQIIIIIEI